VLCFDWQRNQDILNVHYASILANNKKHEFFSDPFLEREREIYLIEYGLWSEEDKNIKTEDSRQILTVKREKKTI